METSNTESKLRRRSSENRENNRSMNSTLSQSLKAFQKTYDVSNKDMARMLVRMACDYNDMIDVPTNSKDWDTAYAEKHEKFKEICKPTFEVLYDLYNQLEQTVADFLIENPDVIKNLKEIRDNEIGEFCGSQKIYPMVGFSFGFDNVFDRLKKGSPYADDFHCGFRIGSKDITLM